MIASYILLGKKVKSILYYNIIIKIRSPKMLSFISAKEAAERWGITKRRVQVLCSTNRIEDAVRIGNMWIIPESAEKPSDSRFKSKIEQKKCPSKNPIRLARNKIKTIFIGSFFMICSSVIY